MAGDETPRSRGLLTPAQAFALFLEEPEAAHEISVRAEAMSERWSHNAIPRRLIIGLISSLLPIPDFRHPVFERILVGVRSRLAANSCDLLLCSTRSFGVDDELWRAAAEQIVAREVDALIAFGISDDDPEYKPILDSGLPVIFVDNDVIGSHAGSVMSANVDGMAEVVRHLHETGRRRIAHISGHLGTRPGTDRLFGYKTELDRLELPSRPEYVEQGDYFAPSGYEAAQRLLALPEPPDAIACASDSMAIGAMAAIEEASLRIPEDIAVSGFDDAEFAVTVRPRLTTMRQDAIGMGTVAAEAVLRMLKDPEAAPPVVVIPTELIIRESSGPAANN
ncbi:MAG: substrate-binding domain-containing protein [Gaiellaceae bacterium]|jgi:LacI family transcriptional regulator